MKKYDKFACHELHIFVYFKDKEFFKDVVKPHIVNKLEKEFIDHFLLGDQDELAKYLRPDFIRDNTNEQALLVLGLANSEAHQDK